MNDRQRLEAIVAVVCKYLPPDGISREETMSQIIELVDPLPAQLEQEPVAWVEKDGELIWHDINAAIGRNLYTWPPETVLLEDYKKLQDIVLDQAMRLMLCEDENQKPVAWANPSDLDNFDMKVRTGGSPLHTVPLYTAPPKRKWIGLTEEEIKKIMQRWRGEFDIRDIERLLKEKNT